ALLIFASPFPSPEMVPDADSEEAYKVQPGWVDGLYAIANKVVYFGPGVYHFTGTGHATLSSSVDWGATSRPGRTPRAPCSTTTHPPPSSGPPASACCRGEMYVYQANPAEGWRNEKSDASSLKMWRGEGVTSGQSWVLHGVTMASPAL